MNRIFTTLIFICFPFFALFAQEISFDSLAFQERRDQVIERQLALFSNAEGTAVFEAYKGLPVNQSIIDYWKDRSLTSGKFDFDLLNINRTGVQNLTADEGGFNVFPNPARGQFNLAFTQPVSGICIIGVHSITGREVFNRQMNGLGFPTMTIKTSGWASGKYTVLVETAEGTMSRKLMAQ